MKRTTRRRRRSTNLKALDRLGPRGKWVRPEPEAPPGGASAPDAASSPARRRSSTKRYARRTRNPGPPPVLLVAVPLALLVLGLGVLVKSSKEAPATYSDSETVTPGVQSAMVAPARPPVARPAPAMRAKPESHQAGAEDSAGQPAMVEHQQTPEEERAAEEARLKEWAVREQRLLQEEQDWITQLGDGMEEEVAKEDGQEEAMPEGPMQEEAMPKEAMPKAAAQN